MAVQADTVLKLSLAAGVLLAGAGVGYYFGIFLPAQAIHETLDTGTKRQIENTDHTADLERARLAEEQRREASQQRYQACMSTADTAYRTRWASGCRVQHERQQAAYDDCADDLFSTREGCARKFPVEPEQGCALPVQISGRLVSDRDAARSQCLGELQGGYAAPQPMAMVTDTAG
jgi:hypothetical protein